MSAKKLKDKSGIMVIVSVLQCLPLLFVDLPDESGATILGVSMFLELFAFVALEENHKDYQISLSLVVGTIGYLITAGVFMALGKEPHIWISILYAILAVISYVVEAIKTYGNK